MNTDNAICITFAEPSPSAHRTSAELRFGPCADVSCGPKQPFYMSQGERGERRYFAVPDGAPAALARGVQIAPGVSARIVPAQGLGTLALAGPGADFATTMRTAPGVRQGLPNLSHAWISAILSGAARG